MKFFEKKIPLLPIIGLFILSWIALGVYFLLIVFNNVWPATLIFQAKGFIEQHRNYDADGLTIDDFMAGLGKVSKNSPVNAEHDTSFSKDYIALNIPDLKDRTQPRVYFNPSEHQTDYRVVVGAFKTGRQEWAGLLVNKKGEVEHVWPLGEEAYKGIYGVSLSKNGSIIYAKGQNLRSVGFCGNVEWDITGPEGLGYHHAASITEDGNYVWTFDRPENAPFPIMSKVDISTGEVVKTIKTSDVRDANPETFIFDLRLKNQETTMPHVNDIDTVTEAFAAQYEGQFKAGDIAVNQRSSNMFYIFDAETLKLKFWYLGSHDGGHDVDFLPSGKITLYNNGSRRSYWGKDYKTTIVEVDPVSNTHTVILDGMDYGNPYSRPNGRQHTRYVATETGEKNYLSVDVSWAGRSIEVNRENKNLAFDFVNIIANDKIAYLSETFPVNADFFTFNPATKCK